MIGWLTLAGSLIFRWLVNWSVGSLVCWLIHWLLVSLVGWTVCFRSGCSFVGWMVVSLIISLVVPLVGSLVCFFGIFVFLFVGLLVCSLVDSFVVCSIRWLNGWLFRLFFVRSLVG